MQCGRYVEDDGGYEVLLYHVPTDSAASVHVTAQATTSGVYRVRPHGPRKLWDEIEHAHRWWVRHSRPARTRYGLTITPTAQQVWLDEPANLVRCVTREL